MIRAIQLTVLLISFNQLINAQGNWLRSAGNTAGEETKDAVFDSNGDLVMTGFFNGTFNTGVTTLTSSGNTDIFIMKMDGDGQLIWAKSFGGAASVSVNALTVGNSGKVHITGVFSGNAEFDPDASTITLTSSPSVFYTAKYDTDGSFLWAFQSGAYGSYYGCDIALDDAENLYSTYQINNSLGLQKRAPNGTLVWTKALNSNSLIKGNAIAVDNFGHILLAGVFRNYTDFDPGPGNVNYYGSLTENAGFVEQLDTNGVFLWVKPLFTNISADYYDLTTDLSGNVFLVGEYRANCDFDPGPAVYLHSTSEISSNAFVQKLDSTGNFKWVKTIDGAFYESGRGIAKDVSGNIFITGLWQGDTDFDPGPNVVNLPTSNSWFVEKLADCAPVTSVASMSACPPYTWVNGITYTTDSIGTYTYCSSTQDGCDSIVTLDLTMVTSMNPMLTSDTLSLTVNVSGADYEWRDCGTGLQVLGQHEQTFVPWQNGSYSVITSLNGCVDTSSCVIIDQLGLSDLPEIVTEIYPNPSNGSFTISGTGTIAISEVKLITMDGKQVGVEMIEETLFGSDFSISCRAGKTSKGIFILQIYTEDGRIIANRIELH